MGLLENWAKLYSNLTPAETALEPWVAALGVPYRVQHPLWALHAFPDFVLLDQRVVIEVDDKGHRTPSKKRADQARTERLTAANWRVLRTTNEKALGDPRAALVEVLHEAGLNHLTIRLPEYLPYRSPMRDKPKKES